MKPDDVRSDVIEAVAAIKQATRESVNDFTLLAQAEVHHLAGALSARWGEACSFPSGVTTVFGVIQHLNQPPSTAV